MIVNSKYAKVFNSDMLTRSKYDELYAVAINRKSQEAFKCVECEHEANADFNAAVNIKNRVGITVLCDKLLKQSDNGTFRPKPFKRGKVKDLLLSFLSNIVKDIEKSKLLTIVNNC